MAKRLTDDEARELALQLTTTLDNKSFALVHALMFHGAKGRGIPKEFNSNGMIAIMDVDAYCTVLARELKKIQREVSENDC